MKWSHRYMDPCLCRCGTCAKTKTSHENKGGIVKKSNIFTNNMGERTASQDAQNKGNMSLRCPLLISSSRMMFVSFYLLKEDICMESFRRKVDGCHCYDEPVPF